MTSVGGMAKAVPPFKWRFHATEYLKCIICAWHMRYDYAVVRRFNISS